MNRSSRNHLYFYNGFNKPEKIDIFDKSFRIKSTYLGDVTDEFYEIVNEYKNKSFETLQNEQPFAHPYNIWVAPTLKDLQEFNRSVGLDNNEYLDQFNGY